MPDENGTEATRSDSPSAKESPVADTEDIAPAAVADEQEADKDAVQEPQDPDDAADEAGPSEELKVVVSIKGGRATIGVQQPSSDPHIESFDDPDLSGLAQEVPAVTKRARARWENEPKYPAHVRPAPPGQATVPSRTGCGAGFNRRGRDSGGTTADAEAVLRAGPLAAQGSQPAALSIFGWR